MPLMPGAFRRCWRMSRACCSCRLSRQATGTCQKLLPHRLQYNTQALIQDHSSSSRQYRSHSWSLLDLLSRHVQLSAVSEELIE